MLFIKTLTTLYIVINTKDFLKKIIFASPWYVSTWLLFCFQVFYNKILKRDSERVQERFEEANAKGVTVIEQRVPINDIVQHINDAGTCIGKSIFYLQISPQEGD